MLKRASVQMVMIGLVLSIVLFLVIHWAIGIVALGLTGLIVYGWIRYFERLDGPSSRTMASTPPIARGNGTRDDPFILQRPAMVQPGGFIESEEIITFKRLIPEHHIRIVDLNEATNGKRFSTLPGDGIGVPSLTVGADLDGIISLKFVFDDSEYQSINGGDYSFLGQIGGHIYFQWDIMVKGDQHYLEALAKQEEVAIRHSGELASLQARFERSMSEVGKVAKEAEAKKEQEEALLASEVEEKSRELAELEGNARLQAEERSANAKEIFRQRKELLEKKRVDQAVRLQLLNEGEIERNQRIQTEISTLKEGVEVSDKVDPLAEQNSDSVQNDDVKSHSPSFEEE